MVAQVLPYVPRAVVGRVSARYIAGEALQDALATVRALNESGASATVDVLGEFVTALDEAAAARREYLALLEGLAVQQLDAQVSVKPTQLGLKLDPAACLSHFRALVQRARELGTLVTLDMEDSSCTDATLELYRTLRRDSPQVSAVLQARLRRSGADLEALLPLQPSVRICKGIYVEPGAIAFQDREEIRRNFLALVERLLRGGGFVGIATHDDVLIERSRALVHQLGVERDRYEFQMLLGVREDRRRRLRAAGYPLRVYVPFGSHWYAYSIRRLKENPAIAGHVLRSLFERR